MTRHLTSELQYASAILICMLRLYPRTCHAKSGGPRPLCFNGFDFEIALAPLRGANFAAFATAWCKFWGHLACAYEMCVSATVMFGNTARKRENAKTGKRENGSGLQGNGMRMELCENARTAKRRENAKTRKRRKRQKRENEHKRCSVLRFSCFLVFSAFSVFLFSCDVRRCDCDISGNQTRKREKLTNHEPILFEFHGPTTGSDRDARTARLSDGGGLTPTLRRTDGLTATE